MATPAVMLPGVSPNSAELSVLLAVVAAAFVVFEYGFASPSVIEFRFAAPYNRLRFGTFAVLVLALVLAFRSGTDNTNFAAVIVGFARSCFMFWDFAYSPLRFFMALTTESDPLSRHLLGFAAAMGLSIGLIGAVLPAVVGWMVDWPIGRRNFNLWVNMPTFCMGDNAVTNLRKSAAISAVFGLCFPFLAPQASLAFFGPLGPISASNSQFLVWIIAIWAFVPAASLLRAVALLKIASLMGNKAPKAA